MTKTLVKTQDDVHKKQAIAPQPHIKQSVKRAQKRSVEGSLNSSSSISMTIPRFHKHQMVRFIGGVGTIKSRRSSAGAWLYTVEMVQGPEPEMGRIGSETMILLYEADLQT